MMFTFRELAIISVVLGNSPDHMPMDEELKSEVLDIAIKIKEEVLPMISGQCDRG